MFGMIFTAAWVNVIILVLLFFTGGLLSEHTEDDTKITNVVGCVAFGIGLVLSMARDDIRRPFASMAIDTSYAQANSILYYTSYFWMVIGLGIVLSIILTAVMNKYTRAHAAARH